MKTCSWDIETWSLKPQFGPILAASVMDCSTGKMLSFRQDLYVRKGLAEDMTDDTQLCLDLRDYLETFHCTVGYFSKGFDISHLRTRLVEFGERPLKKMHHIDLIWYYKGWRGLKPMSSSMRSVAKFFKMEQKPEVEPEVWMKAKAGNKKALSEVVERCEADVRITNAILLKSFELDLIGSIQKY